MKFLKLTLLLVMLISVTHTLRADDELKKEYFPMKSTQTDPSDYEAMYRYRTTMMVPDLIIELISQEEEDPDRLVDNVESLTRCKLLGRYSNDPRSATLLQAIIRKNDWRFCTAVPTYCMNQDFRLDPFLKEAFAINSEPVSDLIYLYTSLIFAVEKEQQENIVDSLLYLYNQGYGKIEAGKLERYNQDKQLLITDLIQKEKDYQDKRFVEILEVFPSSDLDITYDQYLKFLPNILDDMPTRNRKNFVEFDRQALALFPEYIDYQQRHSVLKYYNGHRFSWEAPEDIQYVEEQLAKLEAFLVQDEKAKQQYRQKHKYSTQIKKFKARQVIEDKKQQALKDEQKRLHEQWLEDNKERLEKERAERAFNEKWVCWVSPTLTGLNLSSWKELWPKFKNKEQALLNLLAADEKFVQTANEQFAKGKITLENYQNIISPNKDVELYQATLKEVRESIATIEARFPEVKSTLPLDETD